MEKIMTDEELARKLSEAIGVRHMLIDAATDLIDSMIDAMEKSHRPFITKSELIELRKQIIEGEKADGKEDE